MSDFKQQIDEDIKEYQQQRGAHVSGLNKAEWAFNYWILDKFFYEDEDLILDRIIDYNDKGIDCYEWYEDTKELYLIQNKYYDASSRLPLSYVTNTFLIDPVAVLESGTYAHCQELQNIYSKYKGDENFTVHLQLYITNNNIDPAIRTAVNEYNHIHGPQTMAEVFYLDDIERKWYGEAKKVKKSLRVRIESVNNGTILNISNKEYGLDNGVDAKYALVPVACLYRIVVQAQEKGYMLFESNIREYLGNKGINKHIYLTLKDETERKNFFYYNNGITMICDEISAVKSQKSDTPHVAVSFDVINPQIVNGCQTVSSIHAALKEYENEDLDRQFRDTFVMLKILRIDPNNSDEKKLAESIVRYNNSQNSIDEKNFTANAALFRRIKNEFESKGFLLLTKQSDKNTFKEDYKRQCDFIKLCGRSTDRRAIFGLSDKPKITDLQIPLEKLLQVVLAFKIGGLAAYTQKKDVLKPETETYNQVIEFIKSSNITSDTLLSLYLFFARLEKEKNSDKSRTVIPFYAIDGFCKYECDHDTSKIDPFLADAAHVDYLINLYKSACDAYASTFSTDYTKMIKTAIDYPSFKNYHDMAQKMLSSMNRR